MLLVELRGRAEPFSPPSVRHPQRTEDCRSRQRQRLGRQSSAQDLLARVNAVDDSKALPTPFRRFRDIIRNSLEPLVQGAAGLCTEQVAGHSSLELHAHRAGAGWQVLLLAGPEGCGRDWWSVSLSGFGPLPVVSSGNDSNNCYIAIRLL